MVAKKGDKKLTTSLMAHVAGPKCRYTSVSRIKLAKKTYKLRKGKTAKIKAKLFSKNSRKKLLSSNHCPRFRYVTSNKQVATISKHGKIRAKSKGTCYIYVYAANGMAQKIKVTVR